jgi:hypothetical protein
MGSIVPFERGRVVATLHCRKRKEFSLEWNQLIITIRKFTKIITYTKPGKDIRYLRGDDIKEDMDLTVSLGDSLKQLWLCWKGSKDPRTRGFKNGIKYCRRCRTRKKYQTGSKITIEINRIKLTPESYRHGRTPRTTSYKRTCQAKKDQTSADQGTKQWNTSNGIFG